MTELKKTLTEMDRCSLFGLLFAQLSVVLMHVTDHKEFTDYSTKVIETD